MVNKLAKLALVFSVLIWASSNVIRAAFDRSEHDNNPYSAGEGESENIRALQYR